MTYSDPILVSDGPTDPEYEFDGYSLNPYEEEEEETLRFFEEESYNEENPLKNKLIQILKVVDKLRKLLVEIINE